MIRFLLGFIAGCLITISFYDQVVHVLGVFTSSGNFAH